MNFSLLIKKNPRELLDIYIYIYISQGNLSLGDYTGEQRDKLKQGCMPLRKVKKHLRVNNAQIQYYNFEIWLIGYKMAFNSIIKVPMDKANLNKRKNKK